MNARSRTLAAPAAPLSLRLCASVAVLLLAQGAASAEPPAERLQVAALSVAQLQARYLACDRASRREWLPTAMAVHCSMVGDELMHRAFDGDFDRLIAWWRTQRDEDVADAGPR